jgi:ribosomal protein S18 acetylase RimI-like enzyme
MKITPLSSEMEPLFWQHVYSDISDYYFFILDVKYDAANSKVTLALDEKGKITGMMLIYHNVMAQLRGSNKAIEMLLTQLDLDKPMITTPIEYAPLRLPSRYVVKEKPRGLAVMRLRWGEKTLRIRHDLVRLSTSDAEDIAALMKACNFDWWSEINAQQIAERMKERLWLGVKKERKLVSIGGARIDDWASCIHTVATHKDFRCRGYATSIVSALVEQIMNKSHLALINVETINTPAIRAYTKAGFNPYKNYTVTKAEKIQEK